MDISIHEELCTGCGYCLLSCHVGAISSGGWVVIDPDRCDGYAKCVSACPNHAISAEGYRLPRQDFGGAWDYIVVGAGIGGMMAAAALARGGHKVAVFEQMSFPGGRYTEIDHQGYSVATAAWTPIGPKSNIGQFMADLGAPLQWITLKDLEREGRVPPVYEFLFANGREYESVSGFLSRQEAMAFGRALAQGVRAGSELKGVSTRDYISRFVDNPDLMASIDANVCTASGMTVDTFPASEYICFIQDMRRAGFTFGFPVGGPRAVIEGLQEFIEGNRG